MTEAPPIANGQRPFWTRAVVEVQPRDAIADVGAMLALLRDKVNKHTA